MRLAIIALLLTISGSIFFLPAVHSLTATETVSQISIPESYRADFFVSYLSTGRRGNNATLIIRGTPGEAYSIVVNYQGGRSRAAGVTGENMTKTADSAGYVTWTWRVGTNTRLGLSTIIITEVSADRVFYVPFRVVGR